MPKEKKVDISTPLVVAVIGLIGTIIAAYFGYLSNTKPTELTISAAQTANSSSSQSVSPDSAITFLPILEKDLLIKTFRLAGFGTRVNLRFIAKNLDLDFIFSAPLEMKCDVFLNNLTQHFAIDKYVKVDLSKFSVGDSDVSWHRVWLPIVNGTLVKPCSSQTLHDMGVTNDDVIGLKLQWGLFVVQNTSIHTTVRGTPLPTETPLPTNTPWPHPPDVFP